MKGTKISEPKLGTRGAGNSVTADALAQMPNYARFLKNLLKNKKKLNDLAQVTINEECSAVIQNRLPQKFQDPGSFSIPCNICQFSIDNSLCDVGASIYLIPYSLARKLGMGVIEPTTISLKLADRSVKYPRGIVENVIVKVDKLIFPIDFVVLDMDEDYEVPMILGCPFLATSRALIDVEKGELVLRMNDEKVVFNMLKAASDSPNSNSCSAVNFIDVIHDVWECQQVQLSKGIGPMKNLYRSEASSGRIDQTSSKTVDEPP
ncbi:uncharacterized protein [Henckelia pumila]|uniref:uncharacterized protein n=1 Tax=Henckelia pumila TaxID=405737 RepID=UPI003C6E7CB3